MAFLTRDAPSDVAQAPENVLGKVGHKQQHVCQQLVKGFRLDEVGVYPDSAGILNQPGHTRKHLPLRSVAPKQPRRVAVPLPAADRLLECVHDRVIPAAVADHD